MAERAINEYQYRRHEPPQLGFDIAADLLALLGTAPSPMGLASPRGENRRPSTEGVRSPRDCRERSRWDHLPDDEEQRRGFLRSLDADPRMVATACGCDVKLGARFGCVLPAHAPDGVARVVLRRSGRVVYGCNCDAIERSLTEVYATRLAGIPRERGKPEYVRWKVRLALEAGILIAPAVTLPPLPPEATRFATRVYEGLELLVAVRALTDPPGEPFTFARSFVVEWCGVTPDQAKAALATLRRAYVLVKVGTIPAGEYEANLYVVGEGSA